mmetsp:Transcript_153703/g.492785  ORF Transcript_153703/g.492785 Transcript_153703/m.492785 type:complete len:209 (+) Transcript_153703:509-1135(+)
MEKGLGQFQELLAALKDELADIRCGVDRQDHELILCCQIGYRSPQHLANNWCTNLDTWNLVWVHVLPECRSRVQVEAVSIRSNQACIVYCEFGRLEVAVLRVECNLQHAPMLVKTILPVGGDDPCTPETLCCLLLGSRRPNRPGQCRGTRMLPGRTFLAPTQRSPSFYALHVRNGDFVTIGERTRARPQAILDGRVGDAQCKPRSAWP